VAARPDERQLAAWRAFLRAHATVVDRLDRELQEHSLSLNDYEILVNLSESQGRRMRMSDLADATIQSRSRLSHQISRMEAKGLVTREDCRDDRRGTFAVLTDEGLAALEAAAPGHAAAGSTGRCAATRCPNRSTACRGPEAKGRTPFRPDQR